MHILIHPGWQNSGPDHWQSRWLGELANASRVAQADWQHPDPDDWLAQLDQQLRAQEGKVVMVCHSLGCIALLRWVQQQGQDSARHKVAGALLVAPADVERPGAPADIAGFAPIPMRRLPFPTVVVASDDDPYCRLSRSTDFAQAWGAALEVLPGAGHINAAAGFGPWPAGRKLLDGLLASC